MQSSLPLHSPFRGMQKKKYVNANLSSIFFHQRSEGNGQLANSTHPLSFLSNTRNPAPPLYSPFQDMQGLGNMKPTHFLHFLPRYAGTGKRANLTLPLPSLPPAFLSRHMRGGASPGRDERHFTPTTCFSLPGHNTRHASGVAFTRTRVEGEVRIPLCELHPHSLTFSQDGGGSGSVDEYEYRTHDCSVPLMIYVFWPIVKYSEINPSPNYGG